VAAHSIPSFRKLILENEYAKNAHDHPALRQGGEGVMKTYYHFTGDTLRDGRPIPKPGVWLKHDGPIVPCASGLHASEHPFDALAYAPGNMLHKVNLRGEITPHGDPIDKHCARERRIVATIDAECVMRSFARRVALDAVKRYWLEAPEVVVEYLKTGDETKRAAASAAAWAAARDAAKRKQRDLFKRMVNKEFKKQSELKEA